MSFQSSICIKRDKIITSLFWRRLLQNHYSETDSSVIIFEIDNLVTDRRTSQEKNEMFDVSNLENDPELYDTTKNKALGKFRARMPNGVGK